MYLPFVFLGFVGLIAGSYGVVIYDSRCICSRFTVFQIFYLAIMALSVFLMFVGEVMM